MGTAVQNSRSVWVPLPGCSGWDFGVSGQGQELDWMTFPTWDILWLFLCFRIFLTIPSPSHLSSFPIHRRTETDSAWFDYVEKKSLKYTCLKFFSKCVAVRRIIKLPETWSLIHGKLNSGGEKEFCWSLFYTWFLQSPIFDSLNTLKFVGWVTGNKSGREETSHITWDMEFWLHNSKKKKLGSFLFAVCNKEGSSGNNQLRLCSHHVLI